MKPLSALDLISGLSKEANGLRKLLEQLENPETASTIGGLRSAVKILANSMIRTNETLIRLVCSETTFAPENDMDAFKAIDEILNGKRENQ